MKRFRMLTAGAVALSAVVLGAFGGPPPTHAQSPPPDPATGVPTAAPTGPSAPVGLPGTLGPSGLPGLPSPFGVSQQPVPANIRPGSIPAPVRTVVPKAGGASVPSSVPATSATPAAGARSTSATTAGTGTGTSAVPAGSSTPVPAGSSASIPTTTTPVPTTTTVSSPAAGLHTGETSGVLLIEMAAGSSMGPMPIVAFSGGFHFERSAAVGGATAAGTSVPAAGTAAASSGSAPRITAQPVTVEKVIDAESQRLLDLALKGQEIATVRMLFCRSTSACSATTAQTSYTLVRARISEIAYSDDAETPALTEQITFTYDQIKLSTAGAPNGARSELCFDAVLNKVCASS